MNGQPKQQVRWRLIAWFGVIAFIVAAVIIDMFINPD